MPSLATIQPFLRAYWRMDGTNDIFNNFLLSTDGSYVAAKLGNGTQYTTAKRSWTEEFLASNLTLWPATSAAVSAWVKTSIAGSGALPAVILSVREWEPTISPGWYDRFSISLLNTTPPTLLVLYNAAEFLRVRLPSVDTAVYNHVLVVWTGLGTCLYWNGILLAYRACAQPPPGLYWQTKYYLEVACVSSVVDELAYWTNCPIPFGTEWLALATELYNGGTGRFLYNSGWA